MKRAFTVVLLVALLVCAVPALAVDVTTLTDEELLELKIAVDNEIAARTPAPTPPAPGKDVFNDYLLENGVVLTSTDVQYDYSNNLDKLFSLEGIAELSNYYNYGFGKDLENSYFVLDVRPDGGSYTDRWYIYCHRESFEKVLDAAKSGGKIRVKMVCSIPSNRYNTGQKQMAQLRYIVY